MKVNIRLSELFQKAMSRSMTVEMMEVLAKNILKDYDLHDRYGFPKNLPISSVDAANQIIRDMKEHNRILHLASILIDVHMNGWMGRQYPIPFLSEILREIQDSGFIYDREYKMFVEDSTIRKTTNWGVLVDGNEYNFTFLRLDVIDNTRLVRRYSHEIIDATYNDLRGVVQKCIDKRNGRFWSWEGDGGLVAFYFSKKYTLAVLGAMDIIHELFLYNLLNCRLEKPLGIRIAVHSGLTVFNRNTKEITNDVIKRTEEIESKYTRPNSVTISNEVYLALDPNLQSLMKTITAEDKKLLHYYELRWDN